MTSGVYKITNTVTGKCYIGSSVNIKSRWQQHKGNLGKNRHHAKHLQHSWNKYGKDAFIFEIVYECAPIKDIILFYEQLWIDFYGFKNLYNQLPNAGSALGMRHSNNTKEKCRIDKIDKMVPVIQINMSGEIIHRYESVHEASRAIGMMRGTIHQSIRKYRKCGNSMFVKSVDDIENALRMNSIIVMQKKESNSKTGKKSGKKYGKNNGRRMAQFDKNTLEQINIFNSISGAARSVKTSYYDISLCATGKRKTAGGYIWRYIDDKEI